MSAETAALLLGLYWPFIWATATAAATLIALVARDHGTDEWAPTHTTERAE